MPRQQPSMEKHTDILQQKKVLRELADYNLTCIRTVFEEDSNDPEAERILAKIRKQTKELVKLDMRIDIEIEALDAAMRDVAEGIQDSVGNLQNNVSNVTKQKLSAITDTQIQNHRFIKEVESDISFYTNKNTDAEDGNDRGAVVASEVTGEFKDPFTQVPIRYAVRNKFCGHIYEETTLMNLLQERGNKIKCPAVGCQNKNPVTKDCVAVDYDFESRQRFTQSQK